MVVAVPKASKLHTVLRVYGILLISDSAGCMDGFC